MQRIQQGPALGGALASGPAGATVGRSSFPEPRAAYSWQNPSAFFSCGSGREQYSKAHAPVK